MLITITISTLIMVAQAPAAAQPTDKATDIAYLVVAAQPLKDEPSATAKTIAMVPAMEIVPVVRAETGWLRVLFSAGTKAGWIAAKKDDILPDDILTSLMRQIGMRDETWPAAVKADILRKRPRVGFTEKQVEAALGEPVSRLSEETASGAVEVWGYTDRVVTFLKGRATKITTVK